MEKTYHPGFFIWTTDVLAKLPHYWVTNQVCCLFLSNDSFSWFGSWSKGWWMASAGCYCVFSSSVSSIVISVVGINTKSLSLSFPFALLIAFSFNWCHFLHHYLVCCSNIVAFFPVAPKFLFTRKSRWGFFVASSNINWYTEPNLPFSPVEMSTWVKYTRLSSFSFINRNTAHILDSSEAIFYSSCFFPHDASPHLLDLVNEKEFCYYKNSTLYNIYSPEISLYECSVFINSFLC